MGNLDYIEGEVRLWDAAAVLVLLGWLLALDWLDDFRQVVARPFKRHWRHRPRQG